MNVTSIRINLLRTLLCFSRWPASPPLPINRASAPFCIRQKSASPRPISH